MDGYWFHLWSFVFIINFAVISAKVETTIYEKLVQHLFNGYNKQIRPAVNFGEATNVSFYMTLLQLISVTEKTEQMTSSVYLTLSWIDPRLSWNPSMFEEISQIRLPSQAIWKPDIALHNNNDGKYDTTLPVNALLNSNGVVEWLPAAFYKSSCKIKVDLFPFDWQNCTMKFKSFAYEKSEVFIKSAYSKVVVDKEAYRDNGEWNILHCPIKTNEDFADPSYQDITVYFVIERRPLFYIINIIIPCILISSLSVLVFVLPSASSEKMTMGISVLLGLTVYLLLLAKRVPETSLGVPLIGSYLLFTMISVTISIVCSVIVLNCHHQFFSTAPIPKLWHFLFMDFFPRFLGMKRPKNAHRELFQKGSEKMKMKKFTRFQFDDSHSEADEKSTSSSNPCCSKNRKPERKKRFSGKEPATGNFSCFSREPLQDLDGTTSKKHKSKFENRPDLTLRRSLEKLSLNSDRLDHTPENFSTTFSHQKSTSIEDFDRNSRKVKSSTANGMRGVNIHLNVPQAPRSCSFHCMVCTRSALTNALDFHSSEMCKANRSLSEHHIESTDFGVAYKSNRSNVPSGNHIAKNDISKVLPNSDEKTSFSTNHLKKFKKSKPFFRLKSSKQKHISTNALSVKKEVERESKVRLEETIPNARTLCNQQQSSEKLIIACEAVNYLSERMRDADEDYARKEDWHFIANVLDRLLLILFFCVLIFGIFGYAMKVVFQPHPENPFEDGDPKYANCLES